MKIEEQLPSCNEHSHQNKFVLSTEMTQLKVAQIAKELKILNYHFKASCA